MTSTNEIKDFIIDSDEKLVSAETLMKEYKNKENEIDQEFLDLKEKHRLVLTNIVKNHCRVNLDDGDQIAIFLNSASVQIRLSCMVKKELTHFHVIDISLFEAYDLYFQKLPDTSYADIKEISYPPIKMYASHQFDEHNKNIIKILTLYSYVADEYGQKYSTGLIFWIKKVFTELKEIRDRRGKLNVLITNLNEKMKVYLLEKYFMQVKSWDILKKKDNIVVMFDKKSDFVGFEAYEIANVGSKLIHFTQSYGNIKRLSYFDIFYLKIVREARKNYSNEKELFLKSLAESIYDGQKIEVFNKEDWELFCELYEQQKQNLLSFFNEKGKLTGEYKKISDRYKKIYEKD